MLVASSAFAQSVIINSPGKKANGRHPQRHDLPVTSPTIPNGTIVFSNGLITGVGANVNIPTNATVIDGTGLFVYPGLIDAGSHVGLEEISAVPGTVDTAELGDINPNARAEVAVNPHSNVIPVTRVNGITSVVTEPEGGIISGSSAHDPARRLDAAGDDAEGAAGDAHPLPAPAQRTSFDEQPQDEEATKEAAKNYTKQIDKLRDVFRDAQAYAKRVAARTNDPDIKRFDRDLILEALVPVVEGREPVVMHANLERDIRAALKFADEFKLKVILADAEDVARVIPELKSRNIPVILGPILSLPPREDDPYDLVFSNAKTLNDAGIPFAIQSQDAHNARNLPYHAAACAAFGLPKDVALHSVTIAPGADLRRGGQSRLTGNRQDSPTSSSPTAIRWRSSPT